MEKVKDSQQFTVVQANDLIRNKKDFTLWELRVFTLLASYVKKDDERFYNYRIRIKDLLELFDCKSHNLYEEIRTIPERLQTKLVRVPYFDDEGKERIRTYNLINFSDVPKTFESEAEYIELGFHPDLMPMMLKLKEHFTVYKFNNILKLRSPYIFQLYELLKAEQFKRRDAPIIEISALIEALNIPKSYKFGNIKQRILEPAKKQLKEYTDISFEYKPIKGRNKSIQKIQFEIIVNKTQPDSTLLDEIVSSAEPIAPIGGLDTDFFQKYYPNIAAWVNKDTFRKWMEEFSEEQIIDGINYTRKQLDEGVQIKNIAGYMLSMIRQTNLFSSKSTSDEKKKIRNQKRKQESDLTEKLINSSKEVFTDLMNKTQNWFTENKPDFNIDRPVEELGKDQEFIHILVQMSKKHYPKAFK